MESKEQDKNKNKNYLRIVITGGTGIVGSSFLSHFTRNNHTVLAPSRIELDITDNAKVKNYLKSTSPDVILHFAAFRDAGKAELERGNKKGDVWRTNVVGTRNLIKYSKKNNLYFIYISTDFVFSGNHEDPGPYKEKHPTAKTLKHVSWYGWTKKQAEGIVLSYKNSAVVRIGNVTMNSLEPRRDYIGKIVSLFNEGKLYPMFHDQYLTLTYIPVFVKVIENLISQKKKGIYHVGSSNLFTPFELAKYVLKIAKKDNIILEKTSIKSFLQKFPKRYPQYAGLDSKKTRKEFSLPELSWEKIVEEFIANVVKKKSS